MGYGFSAPFPIPSGLISPSHVSTAGALNNAGQYAGLTAFGRYPLSNAFLFLGDRSLESEFGMISPDNQIDVRGLNDNGDLLTFETLSHTPFILRSGRVWRITLSDPGIVLDDVHAITNAGWIVGRATGGPLGSLHAPVLLKPST
jgi:hypothetical protein